jgi:hypothetical protein
MNIRLDWSDVGPTGICRAIPLSADTPRTTGGWMVTPLQDI